MTLAQVLFVVTAAFLHFWLGRRLGPAAYGVFGVLLVIHSLANLFQNSGLWPALSKRIAESPERAESTFRAAVGAQAAWSVVTTAAALGLAWPLAWLLQDPRMAPFIAVTVLTVPLFSLYGLAGGYHNGRHAFDVQARMLSAYSLARLVGTVALVLVTPRPMWPIAAVIGFAASPLAGAVAGSKELPKPLRPGPGEGAGWKELVRFAAPVTVAAGAMVVVMSVDVLAVKALVGIPDIVGFYGAASTMASLPYFLFSALSVVVLPAVSTARAEQGSKDAARLISDSLRVVVVLLVPTVVLPAAAARELVTVIYGAAFRPAGPPLAVLLFGYGLLAYALIQQNVANGLGRPRASMISGLVGVGVSVAGNALLVPLYGPMGAAVATTLAGVGMVFALRPSLRAEGITSEPGRWARAAVLAAMVAVGIVRWGPPGALSAAAVVAGALAVLSGSRMVGALGGVDVARLRAGLRRAR